MTKIIIQLICPDQRGIIAQLTSSLYKSNANILSIEQHVDNKSKKFYIRIESELNDIKPSLEQLKKELEAINVSLRGNINLHNPNKKLNVAILGSNENEPVYDLLIKNRSENLNCNIPIIISNHNKLEIVANQFDVEYAMTKDNNKILKILNSKNIDLIVLARYMQIIPENIIKAYKNKIINIHHGFLPAFKGANPYRQAAKKGVKLIGATAHYATTELDEGPIISQGVIPVNHTDTEKNMKQLGREIERNILYKAVKAHLEYRIIVYENKTIVFK
tara:strand:+ start:33 stop:860 length:828 start_codon:yes stop_codon:yes gene_type:complete